MNEFRGGAEERQALYGSDMPRASIADAIVFAVYIPPHLRKPRRAHAIRRDAHHTQLKRR